MWWSNAEPPEEQPENVVVGDDPKVTEARLKRLLKQRGLDNQTVDQCTGLEELKNLALQTQTVHSKELSQLEAKTLRRKDSEEELSGAASGLSPGLSPALANQPVVDEELPRSR